MAEPRKIVQGGLKALEAASKAVDAEDAAKAAGKLKGALEAQQAPMTTPKGTGLPLMPRDQGMYTPREQKDLPRMPKVDKARAAGEKPQYTERMQDLLDSPTVRKKVDKLINKGKDLGMTEWYGTEPLRQVAMDAGRTPEQFESLMAQLASASQRNPVDKQNQMGSYLYHLSETGQLPADSLLLTNKLKAALKKDPSLAEGRTLVELPKGYGSLAQGDIFNRAVLIGQGNIGEALPPNKKLGTFYENLLGNLQPVTVDVNAVRGPIIERGDPRWLTSKLVEKDETGKVINSYKPREMYDTGEMTMREAKQRPGFWEAAPSGSEYAGFEDLWQRGAKRHGVDPAEAQALGWYGSADVTALKTKPELYVDNLERLIKRTAEQTGKTPSEVMNDMVTGKGFLRKQGGPVQESEKDMAEFQKRFALHKATGGKVNIPHLSLKKADGGKIAKGLMGAINKASKAVDAEAAGAKALTAAERDANKAKFLEPSAVKERVYHGTGADISEFKPSVIGAMGPGTYVTTNPKTASHYSDVVNHRRDKNSPNVLPLNIQVKNPFPITNVDRSGSEFFLHFDPTGKLSDAEVIELAKKAGYDAVHALQEGEINVFDPRKIKSAIGNRGTYDTKDPDITKADGGKIVKGALSALQKASAAVDAESTLPKVDRLSMNYKDVTKRVPEVADAVEKLLKGEITKAQYNDIVNQYKPVTPYSFVPKPATKEEAIDALRGDAAKSRYGAQAEYTPGSKVGLRLDIPAYTGKGVWVNSVHDEKAKKVAYGPVASVKNADLGISQNESKRIALGGAKAPYAKIKGEWSPITEEEAVAKAQEYLNHPEWRQIGMDPERHSYFYDRATMQPITGAEEVIQIGPLVLGKNPKYGKIEDFDYADGGKVVSKLVNAFKKASNAADALAAERRVFKTTDGFTFKEMPNGEITDGDMSWPNAKQFMKDMPHAWVEGDQLGQRKAMIESFGRPDPQNIMSEFSKFMPTNDPNAALQRALNEQRSQGTLKYTKGEDKNALRLVPPAEKKSGGAVQHDSLEDLAKFHERFALHKATGGKASIPHLSLKRVKKFDGGGMAVQSPEETVTSFEGEKSRGAKIAEKLYEMAKEQGKEEIASLKKPRAVTDLLNRGVLANNPVSAGVDLVNMGLGAVGLGSEKPFLGSEHIKDLMDKYGVTSGEERPLMETGLSFLSPTAVIKGAQKTADVAKKAPEMVQRATNAFTSSKLSPLATEAKTASAGKPTGATYATKQEGPFFRVRPTALDQSTAKGRGVREADELQGQAPLGGGAGSSGSTVPTRLADEEVARIIADPAANEPLNIAKKYTQETQGTEFTLPEIPESSLVKQSAIGRAHQIAVEGSPEYKSSVFDAYAREMPEVLEQAGAKNYDDLMEKAYRQLAKETDAQFQALPYNFSYHRAGEGNYQSSKEMAADVHGNKHLYVFQGGDPHDFLNRIDPVTGLNENEKFRAVHDLLGHAIYGNQFGPKGEEVAWAIHSQMYSPLARLAMTAETRGQNSMVNYSPLNAALKAEIAKYDSLASEARRRGDTALLNEINAAKRQAYSGFQYAPQKAVLLPPEFLDPKYAGGMPSYLEAANRPAKGTETQSVLTHFSHNPELQLVDPKRYGTGIKGAEAERLRDFPGGVRDRSYFYMGEPGAVSPEPGLGVNRYRGEASSLYDITQDPLNFRVLARESNRTPYTAKYNQGITSPLQEANDMERLVKEYGYQGMANPKASKPMAIMFKETPVRRQARGGLTLMK